MNSVFFSFNKYKKILFSFLAAGFCPTNLAFARKIMVLPEAAPSPASLARTQISLLLVLRYIRQFTVYMLSGKTVGDHLTLFLTLNLTYVTVIGLGGLPRFCHIKFHLVDTATSPGDPGWHWDYRLSIWRAVGIALIPVLTDGRGNIKSTVLHRADEKFFKKQRCTNVQINPMSN